jgi:hypothetical protein
MTSPVREDDDASTTPDRDRACTCASLDVEAGEEHHISLASLTLGPSTLTATISTFQMKAHKRNMFFGFGPARDDGVANDFERIDAGDVGGFGGVFAFFRVEPVLGFLEQHEQFGFFGRLDIGGVPALEFVEGIIDVSFEGVFAVLEEGGVSCGTCMRNEKDRHTSVSWTSLSAACIRAICSLSFSRTLESREDPKKVKGTSIFLTRFFFGASASCAFLMTSIASWTSFSSTSSTYADSKYIIPRMFSRVLSLTQEKSPLGSVGTLLATNRAIQGSIRPAGKPCSSTYNVSMSNGPFR